MNETCLVAGFFLFFSIKVDILINELGYSNIRIGSRIALL